MKTKTTSILIISLCILSLVVGIFNSSLNVVQKEKAGKKSDMSKESPVAILKELSSREDKIALINLSGVISAEGESSFMTETQSAQAVLKSLEKAYEDKSVKGILLRINSPGGTVGMSQEIYDSLLRIREKMPVVVSMADVAASGGYYTASAADRIFANRGTLTGSIGVIMGGLNVKEFMTDKLGIRPQVIKSGKYKDTGSIYRQMRQDEQILLQNLVNTTYEQFIKAIKNGRIDRKDTYKEAKTALSEKTLRQFADGRIFTGEQARASGFVDSIGGMHEAKKCIKSMAKEKFPLIRKDIEVISYNKASSFSEIFFGSVESSLHGVLSNTQELENLFPKSTIYSRQPLFIWE